MTPRRLKAIFSIHDVMPGTLSQVEQILSRMSQHGLHSVTLLVVPGLDWTRKQIDQLRRWQDEGYGLAGHGWVHRCRSPHTLVHQLHSWVLSRNVAEHLSESPQTRLEILQRCAEWFVRQGLDRPVLYVPPSWALGLDPRQLRQSPFELVETLTGVIACRSGQCRRLPLVGFEADTLLRWGLLSLFNRANQLASSGSAMPLRVSIHPYDLSLRLGSALERILANRWESIDYPDLFPQELPASG